MCDDVEYGQASFRSGSFVDLQAKAPEVRNTTENGDDGNDQVDDTAARGTEVSRVFN